MAGTEKFNFASLGKPVSSADAFRDVVSQSHPDFCNADAVLDTGQGGYMRAPDTGRTAVIRHTRRIPDSIDNGVVSFGGTQSDTHVEVSMARLDSHEARRRARDIIDSIHNVGFAQTSRNNGNVFGVGTEAEMWAYRQNGTPYELPHNLQEELHGNLWETATKPGLAPHQQRTEIARDVLTRAQMLPDAVFNNTSMPILTSPDELILNTNPAMIPYVLALQTDMFENLFDPADRVAISMWDNLAHSYGFEDLTGMKKHVGNLSLWAMAAAHASVGLSHHMNEYGHVEVSTEHAIAVGDVFNSNLASVGEWMAYSTPMVFGRQPSMLGMTPRDYRAALKLGVLTTYPSDFIMDPHNLDNRIQAAITTGAADRLDRTGYVSEIRHHGERKHVSSSHGRLRTRLAHPNIHEPYNMTGRIEYTGAGSTPDIEATVARNSMLQLLAIHAYEAVACGEHPIDHSGKIYPALATNKGQRYLSHRFNFHGPSDERVASVINQAERLVEDVAHRYDDPAIHELAASAQVGIDKIRSTSTARDLDEFAKNGDGIISDPIRSMIQDGATPFEVAREIHSYQLKQAHILSGAI